MTIAYLDYHLPEELTDKIYREIHKQIMREISIILKYKTVFIMVGDRMSFLVCETQNYYSVLDVI